MSDEQSTLAVIVKLVDELSEPLHRTHENLEEFASGLQGMAAAAGELFAGYEFLDKVIEPAAAMQERIIINNRDFPNPGNLHQTFNFYNYSITCGELDN